MDNQPITEQHTTWKPRFFTIWIGQAFSLFGSQLVQFTLVWHLTRTTQSATVLALATLAAILPAVVLGPFIGAFVDRWNRRVILISTDTFTALTTLVLIYLFWAGSIQPWHIYILLFLRSVAGGFQFPAMQASTSLMVPQAQLARIAGLNQALGGVLNIVAPPAGAFLLGAMPIHNVLMIDIVTALLAVLPLLILTIPQPVRSQTTSSENTVAGLWQDVKIGFHYVRGWNGLMLICIMAALINFILNPAFSLSPLLITKHFGGGVAEIGWFDSLFGIGIVAGGVLLGVWGGFKRKSYTSLIGLAGLGLGVLLIGILPGNAFRFALAAIVFAGLMNSICNGALLAIIQAKVTPDVQGRVMALINSLASGMSPLSLIVAGPVSDATGIQTWYVVGGLMCLIMGAGAFFVAPIRNIEDHQDLASTPA